MAKKIEEHVEYIYVDFHRAEEVWFASDIFDSKEDAINNWTARYDVSASPEGFFLEVVLPDQAKGRAKSIE